MNTSNIMQSYYLAISFKNSFSSFFLQDEHCLHWWLKSGVDFDKLFLYKGELGLDPYWYGT